MASSPCATALMAAEGLFPTPAAPTAASLTAAFAGDEDAADVDQKRPRPVTAVSREPVMSMDMRCVVRALTLSNDGVLYAGALPHQSVSSQRYFLSLALPPVLSLHLLRLLGPRLASPFFSAVVCVCAASLRWVLCDHSFVLCLKQTLSRLPSRRKTKCVRGCEHGRESIARNDKTKRDWRETPARERIQCAVRGGIMRVSPSHLVFLLSCFSQPLFSPLLLPRCLCLSVSASVSLWLRLSFACLSSLLAFLLSRLSALYSLRSRFLA